MIQFADPLYLLFLFLLPGLYWWYRRYGRKNEGSLRVSSADLFANHFKNRGQWRARILKLIQLVVIGLISLGLARPRIVDSLSESKVQVIDIVLVIDISSSMLAQDFQPNRLEAVKATAQNFIVNRPADRIGILVFAKETFVQCPLTVDKEVLSSLLSEITVAEKSYDGTAIGMAIANATNRLRNSPAKSKLMILLSDGSNNAGELDPLTAADLARQFGVKIYTVGAGRKGTAPYPVNDPLFGQRVMQVEVDMDEPTLKEIARITGGQYFRAENEARLEEIYGQIDQLERTEIQVRDYTEYRELFGWFLIPALILGLGYETLNRVVFRSRT
ncbi:MAG: VWA domain-containing protein [Candidatus Neomarinimicrobiota bacterium]